MTVARASQVVTEVLRRNDAPTFRASQVVTEVLSFNPGIIARVSQVPVEVLRANTAEAPTGRPQVFVVT